MYTEEMEKKRKEQVRQDLRRVEIQLIRAVEDAEDAITSRAFSHSKAEKAACTRAIHRAQCREIDARIQIGACLSEIAQDIEDLARATEAEAAEIKGKARKLRERAEIAKSAANNSGRRSPAMLRAQINIALNAAPAPEQAPAPEPEIGDDIDLHLDDIL